MISVSQDAAINTGIVLHSSVSSAPVQEESDALEEYCSSLSSLSTPSSLVLDTSNTEPVMADSHQSSHWNEELHTSVTQLNKIRTNSRSKKAFITRYILNTRTIIDDDRLKRMAFGEKDMSKPHKTILLVGETGVGKSTIINAMVNYMLGVESKDRIWCEIIETNEKQTDSQTHAVIAYDVFTEHCQFSLTIIDTPGFGSTEGKKEDLSIAQSLLELFRCKSGVHEIDAVCLVISSSTTRLTDRQLYVFDSVLSLFGFDMEKNIVVFITRARKRPTNAIKAIKESKILCAQNDEGEPMYFRLDNCHCEDFNDEEIAEDYQASWNLLNKTMESFLTFLKESKAINLKMTEAVLRNRKQLTASIFNINDKIKETELKQKELEQAKNAFLEHEKSGDQNNWEYWVEETYMEKKKIPYSLWNMFTLQATCCDVCKKNCHYPGCWWTTDIAKCSVMDDGKCTNCQCGTSNHKKENKIYVKKTRNVKRTKEDLKRQYEEKSGEAKSLICQIEDDITEMEKSKHMLVEKCYECVFLLEEIALQSHSVCTLQHMDFLIEKVQETGNTDQVQNLQELKKKLMLKLPKEWFHFQSIC